VLNPLLLWASGTTVAGWALLLEFIFTLGMALKCYPLQPGGLLAIEAVILGLTSAEGVSAEVVQAFPVILLLIFMVAGIYFLRDLLLFVFSRLLIAVRSSMLLSMLFCAVAALLSAFLDALTVIAVVVTVGLRFYEIYHRVASGKGHETEHDTTADDAVPALADGGALDREDVIQARLTDRAVPTERLGNLHIGRRLGEEQVRIHQTTGQLGDAQPPLPGNDHRATSCVIHVGLLF